jgi:hypothetical protein
MASQKYLNGVLTVIAFCLVILTLSVVGVFPKASAAPTSSKFVSVPLNADGTMNVNVVNTADVNVANTADVNIKSIAKQDIVQDNPYSSTKGTMPIRK